MTPKKKLILFGAGAVSDWGGPLTSELTELVRESGFYTIDSKTRITEFIYQVLKDGNQFKDSDINFETIINVIEELIVYYSSFNNEPKSPSILKSFFNPKYQDKLLNFTKVSEKNSGRFTLEIPKGKASEYAKRSLEDDTPESFFFKQLYANVLSPIIGRVSKYAYHTNGHSKVITPENETLNLLFSGWISRISPGSSLRMYTLNYDRNFKVIIESLLPGIKVFEGFDQDLINQNYQKIKPDLLKIIEDNNCHTFYNLHGSIFWDVEPRDNAQLPNPYFYLSTIPQFPENLHEYPTKQSEKGKSILLSNIITGYQKTQRSIFAPFKQMLSAFDKDSLTADEIYIIGYSFNDEHINSSLRTAFEYNSDLKIYIVEPGFTKNDFDFNVLVKLFSAIGDGVPRAKTIIPKEKHSFFDGKVIIYESTFKDFLSKIQ